MNSSVDLRLRISKDKLVDTLSTRVEEQLQDLKLQVNGFHIQLEKRGELDVKIDQNVVWIDLPFKVLLKKPSGLFSVEGEGEIMIRLKSFLSFGENLEVNTNTEIDDYRWMSKPKLQLGVLSIPVSTLINMIIERSKDMVCSKVDLAIRKHTDLRMLIDQYIYARLADLPILKELGLNLELNLHKIDIYQVKTMEPFYDANLAVDFSIAINKDGDFRSYPIIQYITATGKTDKDIILPVQLSYPFLEKIIAENTRDMEIGGKKLVIDGLRIKHQEKLNVSGQIISPAEMDFSMTGKVVYDDHTAIIDLKDFESHIKPQGLIYKVFKPLVEKMIAAKIEDFFPLEVEKVLSSYTADLPGEVSVEDIIIKTSWKNIRLRDVTFKGDCVHFVMHIEGVGVDVEQSSFHKESA